MEPVSQWLCTAVQRIACEMPVIAGRHRGNGCDGNSLAVANGQSECRSSNNKRATDLFVPIYLLSHVCCSLERSLTV